MKFKTNTGSLRVNSKPDEDSAEQAPEVSLYDELIVFSSRSPAEQEAPTSQPRAPMAPPVRPPSAPLPSPPSVAAERAFEQTVQTPPPAANVPQLNDAPDSELQPARATNVPNESVYEWLKELAFRLTNQAVAEKEIAVEKTTPPTPEPVRKNTDELARKSAAPHLSFTDDNYLDAQAADLFRITGPLPATKTQTGAASSLQMCANCGSRADSDEMFCITCGELLGATHESTVEIAVDVLCEDCGAMIAGADIFCSSCGAVMSGV